MQILCRYLPIRVIDEVIPVGDLVVHGTAGVAVGNAAIHAAGGLARDLGLAWRDDELAPMANAVGRRLVGPILAVDLEKARDLAHMAHAHRANCQPTSCHRLALSVKPTCRLRGNVPPGAILQDILAPSP